MRISDWSSDVCSSDLHKVLAILAQSASPWYQERLSKARQIMLNGYSFADALWMSKMNFPDKETVREMRAYANMNKFEKMLEKAGHDRLSSNIEKVAEIGRASGRERVCQYV